MLEIFGKIALIAIGGVTLIAIIKLSIYLHTIIY
jgi:hypothetical protein